MKVGDIVRTNEAAKQQHMQPREDGLVTRIDEQRERAWVRWPRNTTSVFYNISFLELIPAE